MPLHAPRPAPPEPVPATPAVARATVAAFLVLVGLRLVYWLAAPPNSDEAYYWLWGLRPALSYFDHPPLHAWVQGLVHAVLGRSLFALRLAPAATAAGTVFVVARMAMQSGGGKRPPLVLAGAVVLASPLFLMLTSFAWHDHLLIFLVLLSASLFSDVLADVAAGQEGSTKKLLAAGATLGLAALAKYSAVFLAVGVAATVLTHPRLRPMLLQARIWGAALLCVAVMSPVLVWNAEHGFASYRFHLADHLVLRFHPVGLVHFLGPTILLLSPVLCFAFLAVLRRGARGSTTYGSILARLGIAVFAASSATFLSMSLVVWTLYYWNVVAYLLLLAPAVGWFGAHSGALRWHLGIGVVLAAAMVFHGAIVPLSALLPGVADDDTFEVYGWEGIVAAIRQEERPGERLLADDYRPAAHLDFTLGGLATVVIADRPSQFDFWPEPALRVGESAIMLTDDREPPKKKLMSRFERFTHLRTVPVSRLGVHLKDYQLWRGEGFLGPIEGPGR